MRQLFSTPHKGVWFEPSTGVGCSSRVFFSYSHLILTQDADGIVDEGQVDKLIDVCLLIRFYEPLTREGILVILS